MKLSRKKIRITMNSPAVLWFVFACFVATLLGEVSKGKITQLLFMSYRSSPKNPLTYLRLFSHVLGHADFGHFVGNAAYLLLLGPMLEEKYKTDMLLTILAATALITAAVNIAFFPDVAICGASGIVFAFIMLSHFAGFRSGEIPLSLVLATLFILGQQVVEGIFVANQVSNLSHIVGGLVGAAFGYGIHKNAT